LPHPANASTNNNGSNNQVRFSFISYPSLFLYFPGTDLLINGIFSAPLFAS